jgi:predicted PurR-regulated permease PerM
VGEHGTRSGAAAGDEPLDEALHEASQARTQAGEARAEAGEARAAAVEARADAVDARADAQEAREEAEEARETQPGSEVGHPAFGQLGRPLRRDSPFMLGFLGALGVFLAWFLIQALVQARSVLILILVSLFLAIGLNPVVEALTRRGLQRRTAIAIVFFVVIGAFVGFGFAVVPPVVEQTNAFVHHLPDYLDDLRKNSTIRQFDEDYGVIDRAKAYVSGGDLGQRMFGGLLGVGRIVLSAVFGAFSVLILTLYFLASLPSMKRQAYRLVPSSRRERVQLLTDEVLQRIGGFVSGAFTVAFIAAITSYIFLLIVGLPYALALAVFVGLLDLVPLVGATIAAVGVTLLGFIESPLAGFSCLVFYVAYQQVENYLIYPRVMRKAVDVPAAVTVVAVLIGGALLGIVGALLAIPTAAAVLLVVRQVAIPRMDRT